MASFSLFLQNSGDLISGVVRAVTEEVLLGKLQKEGISILFFGCDICYVWSRLMWLSISNTLFPSPTIKELKI